jgi:NTP pyrophosphatase (non-canonical NTP hydrolase)
MQLAEFQKRIRDRYFATDNARGIPGTFLWLSEEIGELAHALGKAAKGEPDQANLEEEFADCMAWLCTLANITGVDLEKAIQDKYFGVDGGPKGEK